ncbi:RagB/SusD family nutrient uptake outer membrane protein [Proteiniphilum sp. X52]|uniref:RagB/SusD family nutrient uptake outer membrane protein n=1 Tax=Proteiniphilum sp. X52 TaxID=2382159 RepID=UPI000F0A10AE|nr:RagB/SusD family nutrient uptake outer membrane protein [Proteiniphilum sp. X52]RNC65541.1 RagB/SusD family nutrient uptake outer membrane protein [Proteiniphilum sp. X52]
MKNRNRISIVALFVLFVFMQTACQDMFEPAIENHKNDDDLYNMPAWATGLLGHAYISNPLGSWSFNDVATDDAVSNNPNNGYRLMATGSWRSNNNPMDRWQYLRASWQYLNLFLHIADEVNWAEDPLVADMFKDRMKGDAFGMRALYMYHLLMNHAGWATDGQLLGIPILTEPEDLYSEFNLPRNTFRECVDRLNADVDSAIMLLPDNYGAIDDDNLVPVKYRAKGVTAGQYTRVFGDNAKNRMSARIARAVRAQMALLAASPAYSEGSNVTWEEAANNMAIVLNGLGGNPIAEIDPDGNKWYSNSSTIENLLAGVNPKEILWRGNKENNLTLERDNYPPTLFGSGRVNPTQNLVDAFPMANGYPITDPDSGYDPSNPYTNRDPRLALYIIRNGSTAGPQNTVITTAADGGDNNALNRTETSTRTGYYMKKLLSQSVNANPSSETPAYHYKPFIRYTEIFLGYAEAANEAWGPGGTGTNSYSAYDVIKAIRQRAGIGIDNNDPYLESARNDKDKMRELIHNERRLELCFEGFRFWDLRRWKKDITEPAKGVSISGGNYTVLPQVERRVYQHHMYYGPIPYGEIIKFSNLLQNEGW